MSLQPPTSPYSEHVDRLVRCALDAADPERIIRGALSQGSGELLVGDQPIALMPDGKLLLLSVGKAASLMALTAVQILAEQPEGVIVIRPEYDQRELPSDWQVFQSGHPLPTSGSLAAGAAIQSVLQPLDQRDLVILLLSGGGSALLEVPKPGIELQDLLTVNQDLLRSGAPIEKMNVVRKCMSMIKSGGLAYMAAPARTLTLILSDVVGDDLGVIASGPTVPEVLEPREARRILQDHQLWSHYPARLQAALLARRKHSVGTVAPTNCLIANNATVRQAVAEEAARQGFHVELEAAPLSGEARSAGVDFAEKLVGIGAQKSDVDSCLIRGGETTVIVRGSGKGGRNQELALAAATSLPEDDRHVIISLATDGIDGPTDSAGAVVTGETVRKAYRLGFDPARSLDENDAYPLLEQVGALIKTGPTGTNLNDIAVGLYFAQT